MCEEKGYIVPLCRIFLLAFTLMVGWSNAAEIEITGGTTTWSDDSPFAEGDSVTVNGGGILQVDGDASGKTLSVVVLGETGSPGSEGTGTLDLISIGDLSTDALVLGGENDGILNIAETANLSINDEITFNQGIVTNDGVLDLELLTVNWNNTDPITFQGDGTTLLGTNASGVSLVLDGGTLSTLGDLDASLYVLNDGLLEVNAGALLFDQQLVNATIKLDGATWATDQDQSNGNIIIADAGVLTLGVDQDYSAGTGTLSIYGDTNVLSRVDLNGFDLNLGDVGTSSTVDGGYFSSATPDSVVTWTGGTIQANDSTFNYFNEDTQQYEGVGISLEGDAVLELLEPVVTVTSLSLADDATLLGVDTTLNVEEELSITATSGTNTANIHLDGVGPALINSGATFESDIDLLNSSSNTIENGIFNGAVNIAGLGVTELSGGTFNNTVDIISLDTTISGGEFNDPVNILSLDTTISGGVLNDTVVIESLNAEISGGTFNDAVDLLGVNVAISGGTFNDAVNILALGLTTITGGDFTAALDLGQTGITILSTNSVDSIEILDGAVGTVIIDDDLTVLGSDGVLLQAGTLTIGAGNVLTLTLGELSMQSNTGEGGILNGEGTIVGDLSLTTGLLTGNLTIDGNVTQTGGILSPGDGIGTITITGDLGLADTEIQIGDNGISDTIVVGGETTLANGGTMTIKPTSETTTFAEGDQYTIIQSSGGIVDSGYSVLSEITGFNTFGSIVDTDTYVVTLNRAIPHFTPGARNANNFVNYLYALSAGGDHQTEIMAALQSDTNQRLAAEKLSGESHATSIQALMNLGILRQHILTEQIRPNIQGFFDDSYYGSYNIVRAQFDPNAGFDQTRVWSIGYGMGGQIFGDSDTSSNNISFSGVMAGIEKAFEGGTRRLGFFYDHSYVGVDSQQLVAKNNIETNYFGGYLTRKFSDNYRLFFFGFGNDQYRARRVLNVGSGTDQINEIAQSTYYGWQSMIYAEQGFYMQRGFQPYVGMQYSYIRRNAFEETDADYLALDMNAVNYNSLRSYLGTRLDMPFLEMGRDRRTNKPLGGCVRLQTAWIHELLNKTAPIGNAYLGGSTLPNSFAVEGADCGRDWWLFSVGTKWQLSKSTSLYSDYALLLNARETFHTGSGGLCLSW